MNYLQAMLVYFDRNFLYIPNPKNNGFNALYVMNVICTSVEEDDEYFICNF